MDELEYSKCCDAFCEKVYPVKNRGLLLQALMHPSYCNEMNLPPSGNQRLEFLGDSVIGLIVSRILFEIFPDMDEGRLTRAKAALVNENSLADYARKVSLKDFLILGKGEQRDNGLEKSSILADSFEAVLGAIYLDSGYESAKTFFLSASGLDRDSAAAVLEKKMDSLEAKTRLQELCQKRYGTAPSYRVVEEIGQPHNRIFTVELRIKDLMAIRADGNSKKQAENNAAAEAVRILENHQKKQFP
ncbi:MAG: ribonuclease III [Deltaproteobacteria bacterium]|nr:ribonuclease III [Deltaproteobacteria bacterium]